MTDDADKLEPRHDRRARDCPFWHWEMTNVYGIDLGHCSSCGPIDGPDPCRRPEVEALSDPVQVALAPIQIASGLSQSEHDRQKILDRIGRLLAGMRHSDLRLFERILKRMS